MQYAVYGKRTQANAKPKFRDPEIVVDLIDMRQRRAREREAEQARLAAVNEALFQAHKDSANEAIRKGREAARAFRERELQRFVSRKVGEGSSYASIERRTCKVFGLTKDDIRGPNQSQRVAFARQAVMFWAYVKCRSISLPHLAYIMGRRDHSTISHGKSAYVQKRAKMGRNLKVVSR